MAKKVEEVAVQAVETATEVVATVEEAKEMVEAATKNRGVNLKHIAIAGGILVATIVVIEKAPAWKKKLSHLRDKKRFDSEKKAAMKEPENEE